MEEENEPNYQISSRIAILHCNILSIVFVGSMYIWYIFPSLHSDLKHSQRVIKYRIISASLSCVFAFFYTCFFLDIPFSTYFLSTREIIFNFERSFWSLVHVMIAFAGPLLQLHYEIIDNYRYRTRRSNEKISSIIIPAYKDYFIETYHSFFTLVFWRAIIFAPITEEWVYRSQMIPFLLASGHTKTFCIWFSPLFFGIAHLHHAFQFIFLEKKKVIPVLLQSLFQFGYTSIFGWYSALLLVYNYSVLSPIIAHSFCNSMGFPDFGSIPGHPHRLQLIVCYIAGLIIFFCTLFSFTNLTPFSSLFF